MRRLLAAQRRRGSFVLLPGSRIVLGAVDGSAGSVQPAIEPGTLRGRHPAAGLVAEFAGLNPAFPGFQASSFASGQLAAPYSLADAGLLMRLSLVYDGSMGLCVGQRTDCHCSEHA